MGRPLGPGGTLRHGLLAYQAARMITTVVTKATRFVKICESEANGRQWISCWAVLRVAEAAGVVSEVIVWLRGSIPLASALLSGLDCHLHSLSSHDGQEGISQVCL
jgi:hypothetical protein